MKEDKWITPWTDKKKNIDWDSDRFDQEKHLNQRAFRGFSDYDAWSFDTYIAAVLSNYFKWNRKYNAGYPDGEDEKEWYKKLRRAEKAFADYAEGEYLNGTKENGDIEWALKFFKKYFGIFWS